MNTFTLLKSNLKKNIFVILPKIYANSVKTAQPISIFKPKDVITKKWRKMISTGDAKYEILRPSRHPCALECSV